ncbi:MAG: hypothetical protein ACU836_18215 [Gammaproteobacteria bacterium]
MKCPKCGYQHKRNELPATECPECGIIYSKYYQHLAALENKIRSDTVQSSVRQANDYDWSSIPCALLGLAFGWSVLFAPGEGLVVNLTPANIDKGIMQDMASNVMVEVLEWDCQLKNGYVNIQGRIRNVSSYKLNPDIMGKLVVSETPGGIRVVGHPEASLLPGQTQFFFGQAKYFGQVERCIIESIETPGASPLGFRIVSE